MPPLASGSARMVSKIAFLMPLQKNHIVRLHCALTPQALLRHEQAQEDGAAGRRTEPI
jgi:hypothetical protein